MSKSKKSKAPAESQPAVLDLKAPEAVTPLVTTTAEDEASFSDLGPKRKFGWVGYVVAAVVISGGLFGGFKVIYAQKIYPGTSVNGVYLGGMGKTQAVQTLTQAADIYDKSQILVQYASTTKAVDLAGIGTRVDANAAVDEAYGHGRSGNWRGDVWQMARALVNRPTRIAAVNFDSAKLMPVIDLIADQVDTPVSNASLSFSDTGRVEVNPAVAGQRLDIGAFVFNLEQRIASGSTDALTAPVSQLAPAVSTDALAAVKGQADSYLQGPLTLTFSGQTKTTTVTVKDLVGWLMVSQKPMLPASSNLTLANFGYVTNTAPPVSLAINQGQIAVYVAGLAKTIDQPGQNAALTITGDTATVFQPEKTGYTLDQPAAAAAIIAGLTKPATDRTIALNVKVSEPDVTAASLNSLGINQLISEGVTYFPGSPADRLHNIKVGAARFNGVLIKPGDTFSFEDLLGTVDASTGYLPAYVILPDHTEPKEYGGGLCQVSSTAYRAALLAGLPIVERHPHAYALGYYQAPYGVPGVDATVFDANVDMKFLNDTGHYILIQTILSGTTLKFDFYGTKTKSGVIRGPYFVDPPGGAGWNPKVPSTTVFYRDVLDLNGAVTKTDTVTTHYLSSSLFTLD